MSLPSPVRCSVFIATSLDGFIARTNGDLDWLPGSDGDIGGEDHGFDAFYASIDTIVMGRHTYEKALTFPEWPYGDRRVVVLSSRFPATPTTLREGVQGVASTPRELLRELAASGSRNVYVDGGRTIQRFLQARLVQQLTITRIPILLGDGLPLFGFLERDIQLQHVATRAFASGFVQSTYRLATMAA